MTELQESDIPDDEYFTEQKLFISQRSKFSKDDDQSIIDWIVKHNSYKLLQSDVIWQRMERCDVGGKKSWQVLKDRFIKTIIPSLNQYCVTRVERIKITAGLGLIDEEFNLIVDTDMDTETDCLEHDSPQPRSKILKKTKSKSTDRRGETDSNDGSPQPTKRKRVRKFARVPAESYRLKSSDKSSSSASETSRTDKETDDRDNNIEALLDNTKLPSVLRDQTRDDSLNASELVDRHALITDQDHDLSKSINLDNSQNPSLLRDQTRSALNIDQDHDHDKSLTIPSPEEFSAGLRQASSHIETLGNGEHSRMTSTIRNDTLNDLNNLNNSPDFEQVDENLNNGMGQEAGSLNEEAAPALPEDNLSSSDEEVDVGDDEEQSDDSRDTDSSANLPRIEAQLGYNAAGNEVILQISGMPDNIDPNNIELIRTTSNVDEEGNNSQNNGPLKKLKIICSKGNSKLMNKSVKRWNNKGRYSQKFREPYTRKEDLEIINFIKKQKSRRRFSVSLGGNRIWKRMEEKKICSGRSWESMKERWRKVLSHNYQENDAPELN